MRELKRGPSVDVGKSLTLLVSRQGSEGRRMIRTRNREERIEPCGSDGREVESRVGTWFLTACTQLSLASHGHCVQWKECHVVSD